MKNVEAILEREGLTDEPGRVILAREIRREGRSVARINGRSVSLSQQREIGELLVDVHGQSEHLSLLRVREHLALLDRYAALELLRSRVASAFEDLQRATADLESSQLDDRERAARLDLLRFQLAEIDRVGPVSGEDELLEAERQVLANADRVMRLASDAYDALYGSDDAALARLAVVWRKLDELASLDPRFAPFLAQRDPVRVPLDDLAHYLRGYAGELDASPERQAGCAVRVLDLDENKTKQINCGQSYIEDVPSEELYRWVSHGWIHATTDPASAYEDSKVVLICVPTPLNKTKDPDVSFVVSAVEGLLPYLRKGMLISLESTVYPGFTREVVAPMIEAKSLQIGKDVFLSFSPERVDPGTRSGTSRTPPRWSEA